MRLTKEEIQFIDDYLDNSDVVYANIRMEMVDHVASDIEAKIEAGDTRDFYYIFKDYMVENKARLLSDNKQFLNTTDKKLFKALCRELISWQSILLFVVTLTLLYIMQSNFHDNVLMPWLIGFPLIGFILFAIGYFFGLKFLKLERYSAVERISFMFNAFFQIFNLIRILTKRTIDEPHIVYVLVIVSLAIALLYALAKVTITMVNSSHSKFKTLA